MSLTERLRTSLALILRAAGKENLKARLPQRSACAVTMKTTGAARVLALLQPCAIERCAMMP